LYAYKGGSLYQPVYLGVRDDVGADCLADLKYKSEAGGGLVAAEDEPENPVEIIPQKKPPVETTVKAHSGFRRVLWKE
jgi:hypothetical protein